VPSERYWSSPMEADDLQRLIDSSPVHRALRLRVASADQGKVVFAAQTGAEHAGEDGGQFLHGGVVATLLDTAATFALIQVTGTDWGTVDLRVDFVRPAPAGPLTAEATAVHAGRRLGRASAALTDPSSGQLIATAAGTFVRTTPLPE
jgi:uncharacterized protein (TIGR00369 family)